MCDYTKPEAATVKLLSPPFQYDGHINALR